MKHRGIRYAKHYKLQPQRAILPEKEEELEECKVK